MAGARSWFNQEYEPPVGSWFETPIKDLEKKRQERLKFITTYNMSPEDISEGYRIGGIQEGQGTQITPEQKGLRKRYVEMQDMIKAGTQAKTRGSLKDYELGELGDMIQNYQKTITEKMKGGFDATLDQQTLDALSQEFNRRLKISAPKTGVPTGASTQAQPPWFKGVLHQSSGGILFPNLQKYYPKYQNLQAPQTTKKEKNPLGL